MRKNHYINEDGFACYTLECGCESIKIPNMGWTTILCEEHEEEYEEEQTPSHQFKKYRKMEEQIYGF